MSTVYTTISTSIDGVSFHRLKIINDDISMAFQYSDGIKDNAMYN